MDLRVLHPVQSPDRNYSVKDKLNSLTGHLDCRFLEWTGWYNQDIYQRLLGHYRLYQLFKKENGSDNSHLPLSVSYILNYKTSHSIKYFLSRITACLYYVMSFGKIYSPFQIEAINKLLVHEHAGILQEFLTNTDENFEQALSEAVNRIASLSLNQRKNNVHLHLNQMAVTLQARNEYKSYHTSQHYFNEYNTIQSATNGIKGKEKGVFSKKQILIFFDLLAEAGKIERIDFTRPNKFDSIADLLCAITGKTKESWVEQLKDCRNKGLYEFTNVGERKQLIVMLTNLSGFFRKAGLRSIAIVADKKLSWLERQIPR